MTVWVIITNFDEGARVLSVQAHYDAAIREAKDVLMEALGVGVDDVVVRPVTNTAAYVTDFDDSDEYVGVFQKILKNE